MTNEKFTPGEWEVEEHELAVGNYAMVGFRIRTDSKIICAAKSNELKNKPEMQANAALIAAAPEMYHRLKEVKGDFRALLFNPYISQHTKECIEVMIDHIEKVLKKARGGGRMTTDELNKQYDNLLRKEGYIAGMFAIANMIEKYLPKLQKLNGKQCCTVLFESIQEQAKERKKECEKQEVRFIVPSIEG